MRQAISWSPRSFARCRTLGKDRAARPSFVSFIYINIGETLSYLPGGAVALASQKFSLN